MTKKSFQFKILSKDKESKARAGEIHTPHGSIKTPAFVAVGTQATVKGLSPDELQEIGVELLFGNTYHLHLRPGEEVVEEFGGVSKFMNWNGPTITDSGGFQVFSLGQVFLSSLESGSRAMARTRFGISKNEEEMLNQVQHDKSEEAEIKLVKITKDGVEFRSHIDGSLHEFTPEISIEIQKKLGADIILCFDECAPHPSTYEYTKEAMERTHTWALRSLAEFHRGHPELVSGSTTTTKEMPKQVRHDKENNQALYGIIQGGVYKDLREESAKFISELPFDGIAIGGVAVGESKSQMRDVLSWVHPYLPDNKPRHLLGIGEIDDIFAGVEMGMDTFDCVIPTRFGRYGILFVPPWEAETEGRFRIDINRKIYAKDKRPLSKDCPCKVCKEFTRGYIHHLFKANELLGYRLASYHNMYFIVNLVKKIRESILAGTFEQMKKEWAG